METIKINRLSDFQIKIKEIKISNENIIINVKEQHLAFHFLSGNRKFTAINNPNGDNINCHIDNQGYLIIDIPSKKLGVGELFYFIEVIEDNEYFKDKTKNTFGTEYLSTNIEIIDI